MADQGFVKLDTSALQAFIDEKASLLSEYDAIDQRYDEIVNRLLENWEGKGAIAFSADAGKVKTNITGIYDILKSMCDILEDCIEAYSQCDTTLGTYNQEPS